MKYGKMTLSVAVVAAALLLSGCTGGGGGGSSAGESDGFADMLTSMPADSRVEQGDGERKVFHNATTADGAYLKQTTPIKEDRATLYVNGMGCPQCVTNVDLALEKNGYAERVRVDLGSGLVYLKFPAGQHPSPAQLAKVIDRDFTLVKIVPKG